MAFGRDAPQPGATQPGIPALITRLADGLGKLVTEHITLAKLELTEDARAVGTQVGKLLAFVPFLLVGYALLCGALAVVLAPYLGMAGALLLVGGVNVAGGIYGVYRAAQKLRSHKVMDGTIAEFSQSAQVLAQSAAPTENGPARNQLKELNHGE